MPKRALILLRHGATEWNHTGRFNSYTDTDLDATGSQQAARAARELSGLPIDRVVISPSRRAIATVAPLRQLVPNGDVLWEEDDRLRELDFGCFEGKAPTELSRCSLDAEFSAWQNGHESVAPAGVETYGLASDRAQQLFDTLDEAHRVTVFVTHGYLARILLARCVLGLSPSSCRRLRLDNGRFAVVAWERRIPRLVAFNTVSLDSVFES